MPGSPSSQSMDIDVSKDVTSSTPNLAPEDAASSLRAAALLTLKFNKRRKPVTEQSAPPRAPSRSVTVDNSVQLDYGQDDIASSPPETLARQNSPPSKPTQIDMEDGQILEEGEISDSEDPKVAAATPAMTNQPKATPPPLSPTSNRPIPSTPSLDMHSEATHNNSSPKSVIVPKVESPTHNLLDRISDAPIPAPKSLPQMTEEPVIDYSPYFVDADHVRPGLELNQGQYDTAKDIVLDLLGWGVPPEYLVDCGLSREIVFYVFSELNLRLPDNLDVRGIVPYIPSTIGALLRAPDSLSSPISSDSGGQRLSGHPSLPPKPSQDRSSTNPSKISEPVTDSVGALALQDMERQRRQELLARKAVQASRKPRSSSTSPITKVVAAIDQDVEMAALAPTESVDDFLKSIGPVGAGSTYAFPDDKMDVDEIPGLGRSSVSSKASASSAQQEGVPVVSDQMVASPADQSSFPLQADQPPPSSTETSTSGQISRRSSASEDPSTSSNGNQRRAGKRPVAADFVDFDAAPRSRNGQNGSNLKRKSGGSFASVSTMRRCVIDLSDSEGEMDGEDSQMDAPTRNSPPPDPSTSNSGVSHRTTSPAALAEKEMEIQKMRQMIAEREKGRIRKLKKLEAMSNPGTPVSIKQEEEDPTVSLRTPVNEPTLAELSIGMLILLLSKAWILTCGTGQENIASTLSNGPPLSSLPVSQLTQSTSFSLSRLIFFLLDINGASTAEISIPTPSDDQAQTQTEKVQAPEDRQNVAEGAVDVDPASSSSAQMTTPALSQHLPRPEEKEVLQPEKHEDGVTYISIFDSYPLLRSRSRPVLPRESDAAAIPSKPVFTFSSLSISNHSSTSAVSSSLPSTTSSSPLFSLSSDAVPFVHGHLDLRPLRLASVSQSLDSTKRLCQYEIPGGGVCRDEGCADIHFSRTGDGSSAGGNFANGEPGDQDTAKYLSTAVPDRWVSAYGSSLTTRIMAALEDVRLNHPKMKLEERVARVLTVLEPQPPTA